MESLRMLKRAAEMDPRSVPVLINLAITYSRLNWHNQADRCIDEIMTIDSTLGEPYSYRGIRKLARGDTAQALLLFQKAIQLDPACASAHNNLGVLLLGQGRPKAAKGYFEDAIRYSGQPSRYWLCINWPLGTCDELRYYEPCGL